MDAAAQSSIIEFIKILSPIIASIVVIVQVSSWKTSITLKVEEIKKSAEEERVRVYDEIKRLKDYLIEKINDSDKSSSKTVDELSKLSASLAKISEAAASIRTTISEHDRRLISHEQSAEKIAKHEAEISVLKEKSSRTSKRTSVRAQQ